jgi:hypothetical protein
MAPCCRVFPFYELTRFLGAVNVLYASILFEDGLDIFEQGYRSLLRIPDGESLDPDH